MLSPGKLFDYKNPCHWPAFSLQETNNVLNKVVALSTKNVWAVGYGTDIHGIYQTLIEHWNGTSWSVIPSPNPGSNYNVLNGIAHVPGTKELWAVGYYQNDAVGLYETLIEQWDGISWSVIPSPNPGPSFNLLYGVTAVSANNVWAAGYTFDSSNSFSQTLIMQWNGTSWNVVSSPNLGTYINRLFGITTISANNVWAVGYKADYGGGTQTLIEQWNGTSWSVVSSPNPGLSSNYLYGVARVPGSRQLWTVGTYQNDGSSSQTLTEFHC